MVGVQKIAIVLAAGKGTRMRSEHAKVAHEIMGKPMLNWVLDALEPAGFDHTYVVIGHKAEEIENLVGDSITCVLQKEQLGTGHAVQTVMQMIGDRLDKDGTVLVTCGDTPLIEGDTFKAFVDYHENHNHVVDVLTVENPNPTGYGRIVRNADDIVEQIVEEKDASDYIRRIKETNVGTYCFNLAFMRKALLALDTNNAQGEFYLTDLVRIARQKNLMAGAFLLDHVSDSLGVNNRVQLAEANQLMRVKINEKHMMSGVTMVDPSTCYIEADVTIDQDTFIEPNVLLLGQTHIAKNCFIGSQSKLTDAKIGEGSYVQASHLWQAEVGKQCKIGPYAYLRPGTRLEDNVKIGDFVEVKNSDIGGGSKIPHLAYVGDAIFGERVNFSCGAIVCNYDGKTKEQTVLGNDVFVGSNSNLVAPITLHDHAYIGAGSTITKDVPANVLAVARSRQTIIERKNKKDNKTEDK